MANDLIPGDVKQFIFDKIDSVAELEGLLLLRKNPETSWSVRELAKGLYSTEQQSEEVLERLHTSGFLAIKEGKYYYQPATLKLGEMVDQVAEIYSKYLIPVTNLIHNKPQAKIQQFADAFKFRKEEEK